MGYSAQQAAPASDAAVRFDGAPPAALAQLYTQVVRSASTQSDRTAFVLDLVQKAVAVTNALGGVYFLPDGNRGLLLGPRVLSKDLLARCPRAAQELGRHADAALQTGRVNVEVLLRGQHNITAILVPVRPGERPAEVLSLVVSVPAGQPIEPFLVVLQLFAGYVNLWESRAAAVNLEWEAGTSAAIVELLIQVQAAKGLDEAGVELASQLKKLLRCETVAIGICDTDGGRCRLQALSGLSGFDKRSALTRAFEATFDESLAQGAARLWPAENDTSATVLRAHRKLQKATGGARLLSIPLRRGEDRNVGAIVFSWADEVEHIERLRNVATALAAPVGGALGMHADRRTGRFARLFDAGYRNAGRWRRALYVVVPVALCIALLWPAPFRISADVMLKPVSQRFVVAPFDGILRKVLVKPGEIVQPGELLARMDGREIEWQLASLKADYASSEKTRDIKMARADTSGAQLARLEMKRAKVKIDTLEHRLGNLELKSPIAGVVISGDLSDLAGSPVKIGSTLFQVAPLRKLYAELAIPDQDIAYVQTGQPTRLTLAALPGSEWQRPLEQVEPKSTIKDGANVFIGRYTIANPNQTLRPGMEGEASVLAGKRPLGWVLFHRPWEQIALWAGFSAGEFSAGGERSQTPSLAQRASTRIEATANRVFTSGPDSVWPGVRSAIDRSGQYLRTRYLQLEAWVGTRFGGHDAADGRAGDTE